MGLHWSSCTMEVTLSQEKLTTLQKVADTILQLPVPHTCHRIQRLLRRVNFAAIAVPRAKLHSRVLQREAYRSPRDLFCPCKLSLMVCQELVWWLEPPQTAMSLMPLLPQLTITSDASKAGWRAQWDDKTASGTWNKQEQYPRDEGCALWSQNLGPPPQRNHSSLALGQQTVVANLLKEGGPGHGTYASSQRRSFISWTSGRSASGQRT